ncbi:MAG TPA: TolC family protein, partial [Kofleriaceae bacterium]
MKWFSAMFLAAPIGIAAAQPAAQPAAPTTAPGVTPAGTEVLTLERAIEIAMRQQPSLRQSKAQVEAAQGRADLARVARNPTIALDATAGTSSSFTTGSGAGTSARTGDFFS